MKADLWWSEILTTTIKIQWKNEAMKESKFMVDLVMFPLFRFCWHDNISSSGQWNLNRIGLSVVNRACWAIRIRIVDVVPIDHPGRKLCPITPWNWHFPSDLSRSIPRAELQWWWGAQLRSPKRSVICRPRSPWLETRDGSSWRILRFGDRGREKATSLDRRWAATREEKHLWLFQKRRAGLTKLTKFVLRLSFCDTRLN
jgi:hypothetical protein